MHSSSSHSLNYHLSNSNSHSPPPLPMPPKLSILSSSPSRAQTLPTPVLARLLPTKPSARTRTHTSLFPSLNSPNNSNPSSPTVTCIGQVRITKNHSKTNRSQSDHAKKVPSLLRFCRFCFLRCNHSASRKDRAVATEPVSLPLNDVRDIVLRKSEDVVPPNNALLLMRCRSAPHNRCSALATRRAEGEVLKVMERGKIFYEEKRCASARPLGLKRSNSEPVMRLVVPDVAQESVAPAMIKN